MLLSVWNNLSTYSIIAGLLSVRGVIGNCLKYSCETNLFCSCIEVKFWYIPSGWMHSLDFFCLCVFGVLVELRLYLSSYQLVFYSNQHQRLFINHFWSMVDTISPVTSSILLQFNQRWNILWDLYFTDEVEVFIFLSYVWQIVFGMYR